MKRWTHETEIEAPIDQVWKLLNGPLEDIKKIMPNLIKIKTVKETDEVVGSIHRETYEDDKKIQEYDVETLIYQDDPEQKELKVGFTVSTMFEITTHYELEKLDSGKTSFKYTTTNKPLKWFLRLLMGLGSNKVVVQFVDRVKNVAENEVKKSCSS